MGIMAEAPRAMPRKPTPQLVATAKQAQKTRDQAGHSIRKMVSIVHEVASASMTDNCLSVAASNRSISGL
jgi:hypothetical protein